MSYPFDDRLGLVVVPGELSGPSGNVVIRLAVDTGATQTMINIGPLALMGYDPSLIPDRVQVTTGSGVEYAPQVSVTSMTALGQEREDFPVLAHTLPASARIDGQSYDIVSWRMNRIDGRSAKRAASHSSPSVWDGVNVQSSD